MPPKDYVPGVLFCKMRDGSYMEVQNTQTVSELTERLEKMEFVQVTRCKDCKYYAIAQLKKDYTPDERYKPSVCIKGEFAVTRPPEWYCADGERRE